MAQQMPGEQPTELPEPQAGTEPEEESGAGYGNHAMPDVGGEAADPDKDAR